MPTFRDFQASREWRDDISPIMGAGVTEQVPGFVYQGDLYIIATGPAPYTLEWMGDEEASDDLDAMESKLYRLAKLEGYLP